MPSSPGGGETLIDWLKAYGELNGYVGLTTGAVDARFARLCERLGSKAALAWTTPSLWASGGPAVRVQFPFAGVQFDCRLEDDDRVIAERVQVIEDGAPNPRDLAHSLGVQLSR